MSSATGSDRTSTATAAAERPRRGDQLELRIEGVAHGGAGVARRERLRGVRGRRLPRRAWCAPRSPSRSATTRTRAPSRCSSRAPTGCPSRCDHEGGDAPGSPWQALRYERQLEHKHELVGDALRRLGAPGRASSSSRSSRRRTPWRYRNKMEYSFGDVRGRRRSCSASTRRGRWDAVDDARDCMLASERSNAVRNLVRDWCARRGPGRATTAAPARGFLRNLVVREGRRTGDLQVRLVTSRGRVRRARRLRGALRERIPERRRAVDPHRQRSPR